MSGRKNKFSKAMTHLKSGKIDEKIGYLNKEMKKAGVISEVMGNTTSDLYCTTEYIPPVPESPTEYTDVPDPEGVRSDGWTQPSNGYDASDPATWENAFDDFSWLYNPNDVAGETDRPVVKSVNPDWSGAAAGGGMLAANVNWGMSLGYVTDAGVYRPMITSNLFGSIVPPTDNQRHGDGQYRNVSDEQWAQMLSLWSTYQSTGLTTKSINCWFPWSYFHNGPWDSYSGTKRSDYHILISAGVFTTANEYVSKPHENEIPGRTVVLTQHGIDDPNYYPGNPNGFMDFLRDALGAGKEALDWLLDQLYDEKIAQGQTEYGKTDYGLKKDGSLGMPDDDWGKGVGDEDELLDLLGGTRASAGKGGSPGQKYTDPNAGKKFSPSTLPKGWKPGDPLPKLASFPKVYSDADTSLGAQDGSLVAWGGSKQEKTLDPNNNNLRRDVQYAVMGAYRGGEEAFVQKYGYSSNDVNNFVFHGVPLPKKKKNENYEPQGELIKEGWESPKHTYIDKDQQKRWFKEKDVAPAYPKKAPPKMINGYHPSLLPKLDTPIPQIKVKKKDLIRGHNLKKDEAKKVLAIVDSLNDYIKRNPEHLAYARERYPKHDPRLARLNYQMDMQIAAADEYVEKHFPENKRLLNRVLKATKQSIKLTDPKTFKSEDGVFTTFNKLERARHFDNEYKPKQRKVIKKRRGKSVGRFFYKPKKKSKYDILKDKMVVLDKEMKKMMPDA